MRTAFDELHLRAIAPLALALLCAGGCGGTSGGDSSPIPSTGVPVAALGARGVKVADHATAPPPGTTPDPYGGDPFGTDPFLNPPPTVQPAPPPAQPPPDPFGAPPSMPSTPVAPTPPPPPKPPTTGVPL